MDRSKRNWLIQSTLGLLLTGSGLSMAIDAGAVKAAGGSWVLYGTAALVVFNSGLCIVVGAGLSKLKSDLKK
jgi:hypothetical protein